MKNKKNLTVLNFRLQIAEKFQQRLLPTKTRSNQTNLVIYTNRPSQYTRQFLLKIVSCPLKLCNQLLKPIRHHKEILVGNRCVDQEL